MTDQEPTADHTSSVGCSNTAIYIIPDWLGAPQQRQASRTIICYKKEHGKDLSFQDNPFPTFDLHVRHDVRDVCMERTQKLSSLNTR